MKIAAIGECMIEISDRGDGGALRSFGGDTLNTAIYLSRLGANVDYVTALGDDPYSNEMLDAWCAEGIGTSLVRRFAGDVPGLYMIRTDNAGECSFHYWRSRAPARRMFEGPEGAALVEALSAYGMIYFSGITLSILDDAGRARLSEAAKAVKAAGGEVVFDGNYRPRGWQDAEAARRAFGEILAHATLALPTFDDEQALYGDAGPDEVIDRLRGLGIEQVVVKSGPEGVLLLADGNRPRIPVPERVDPVDTTAAGDSFNAGYLAARLSGLGAEEAALSGHRLAVRVVAHHGAIIDRDMMRAHGTGTGQADDRILKTPS
jgi:2-dehydro-3-deoxygluconokinase